MFLRTRPGRGVRSLGPGLLPEVRLSRARCVVEAGLSRCLLGKVPWVVEGLFVGYKGIQGAFEQLWRSGAGSAEESGILQRQGQGCVEAS
jgi:hypothetical protein